MRKLLIAIAVLIVIGVAAVLIAPFLIPTDTYASRIEAAVKSATGRDLKIAGPVKLSFLPRLELEASQVSFANAPGAHAPQMLRLKQLEVTLRLLPLLVGNVELGRFVLTEPEIALEIDKSGRPNWVFATAASQGAAPAKNASAASGSPSSGAPVSISGLSLGDVRLIDGKLSYRDDRTGTTQTLDAIDMTLSLPDLDHPFAGEGSAVWHGQKIALSVGVRNPRALLNGGESDVGMHL
ncbi:MAG: AsmA family protein, partial [Stellaceae bacterium]